MGIVHKYVSTNVSNQEAHIGWYLYEIIGTIRPKQKEFCRPEAKNIHAAGGVGRLQWRLSFEHTRTEECSAPWD